MLKQSVVVYCSVLIIFSLSLTNAKIRRCFQCRSRGDLGSCKDPFTINVTLIDNERGVEAVPCASGWCGKVLEGGDSYAQDDYDKATQRMCVQRGPSDSQDRCAYTIYNYRKVFMCFCQGDLCNSSNPVTFNFQILMLSCTISVGYIVKHWLMSR